MTQRTLIFQLLCLLLHPIADDLHFANASFFGKYFKEAVGISPKKWIKQDDR